ncbi:MAG: TlyA family RNA methyltransferase [Clostridia bacterium]|nr:TlyA family RNA methyltransferase [Clostridia bacterium]
MSEQISRQGKETKKRADVLLHERGLCESREKAQAAIMAGEVYTGEKKILKPSELLPESAPLTVRAPAHPYVGRGGLKLEKALSAFHADVTGAVCMDIGCATGGFTDVLLRAGASHVYAVDVGYGQFDWNLRQDPRVTLMERTNARGLTPEMVPLHPTVTVMDVSFISIRLLLPVCAAIMGEEGVFYTLIKPQFEAGRGKVGKNGVVRDPRVHEEVLTGIVSFCETIGLQVRALDFSPITGPKGNIEFLAEIRAYDPACPGVDAAAIRRLVSDAHSAL